MPRGQLAFAIFPLMLFKKGFGNQIKGVKRARTVAFAVITARFRLNSQMRPWTSSDNLGLSRIHAEEFTECQRPNHKNSTHSIGQSKVPGELQ